MPWDAIVIADIVPQLCMFLRTDSHTGYALRRLYRSSFDGAAEALIRGKRVVTTRICDLSGYKMWNERRVLVKGLYGLHVNQNLFVDSKKTH